MKLVVDHIIPKAKDGKDVPSNLLAACSECNAGKGSLDIVELVLKAIS